MCVSSIRRRSAKRKSSPAALQRPMRRFTGRWRGLRSRSATYSLEKPPSVSEMIDFANALQLLGTDHVTEDHRDVLLPFLAKTEKDRRHLLLREGFKSLLDDGARFAQSLALPGGPTS